MKIINVQLSGLDLSDHPDYVDTYIESAQYEDGTDVPDEVLEELDISEYLTSDYIADYFADYASSLYECYHI